MELQFALAAKSREIAFEIGNLSVRWYGLILTFAMVLGLIWIIFYGKKKGYTSDDMIELFLWIIPLAVIFARIVYVIVRPAPTDGYFPVEGWGFKELFDGYTKPHTFVNLFAIWNGGITIIGGVIGGIIGGAIFAHKKHFKLSSLFDIAIPVLLFAQGIGRWGNFINQEAYGLAVTNPAWQWFPFAVQIGQNYYAATFFYAFVWNVTGAVLIFLATRKCKVTGMSVFMYLTWYCFKRGILEFIRLDAVGYHEGGDVPLTQILMFVCVAAGIVGGILYYRRGLNKLEHEAVAAEVNAYIESNK